MNAAPVFAHHPKIVKGASDLMVEVFGPERGAHVRFAVGSASLPSNAAVGIEAKFAVS